MNGLREVVVRPGFDAVDPICQFRLARDENHGSEPRSGIGFQLPADFQAVDERHGDVEEDDVGPMSMNSCESGGTIRGEHVVTVGAEETMEQRADGFSIVGKQHAAPPCFRGRFAHDYTFSYRLP